MWWIDEIRGIGGILWCVSVNYRTGIIVWNARRSQKRKQHCKQIKTCYRQTTGYLVKRMAHSTFCKNNFTLLQYLSVYCWYYTESSDIFLTWQILIRKICHTLIAKILWLAEVCKDKMIYSGTTHWIAKFTSQVVLI